jgi:hypothetical protein
MSVLLFVELERQIWLPSYSALSMFGTSMNSYGTGLIQNAGLHYGNGGTGGSFQVINGYISASPGTGQN